MAIKCNEVTPQCPDCGYVMNGDDMLAAGEDLLAIAPNEERCTVKCPICDIEYWVRGSYKPVYYSSLAEEDL